MRHRGFNTRGIHAGPFATCLADFVPKNFQLFDFHTGSPIIYLLPQREEAAEKGIQPKVNETQGFQYLGHSNSTIC